MKALLQNLGDNPVKCIKLWNALESPILSVLTQPTYSWDYRGSHVFHHIDVHSITAVERAVWGFCRGGTFDVMTDYLDIVKLIVGVDRS